LHTPLIIVSIIQDKIKIQVKKIRRKVNGINVRDYYHEMKKLAGKVRRMTKEVSNLLSNHFDTDVNPLSAAAQFA
jgi:hypothetical protein